MEAVGSTHLDAAASSPQGIESLDSLPALRKKIRERVEAETKSLPTKETASYREAVQKCPDLVQTETDPLQFVRYCGYDVWKAAKRLCCYWEERKRLFKERAFLPLILTGFGALQEQEVMLLQAGYPAILPDSAAGQKVLFVDRRKLVPGTTCEHKLKVLFYILAHLAQQDSGTQTEGILVLAVLCTPRLFDMDTEFRNRGLHIAANAIPCQFNLHFLSIPHQKKPYMVQDFMIDVVVPCMEAMLPVDVHIEGERGDLCEQLTEIGLSKRGIPMTLGGGALWKFEECFRWVRERKELERAQYRGCVQFNEVVPVTSSSGVSAPNNNNNNNNAPAGDNALTRRRMADMLHSRRKRERRRQHVMSLKENSQSLTQENQALKTENKRLQGLFEQAQRFVSKSRGAVSEDDSRKRKTPPA